MTYKTVLVTKNISASSGMKKVLNKQRAKGKTTTIKKLTKDVKHLKALERGAIIYDNYVSGSLVPTTAGLITYIHPALNADLVELPNAIGDDATYKMFYKRIDVRMQLQGANLGGVSTGDGATIRCIYYQDMANKSALAGVTDVLLTASYLSPINQKNQKRFKILSDKTYTLNSAYYDPNIGIGGPAPIVLNTQFHHKFNNNKQIEYVTLGGTVAACQIGQIFLLLICDTIVSPTFFMNSRIEGEAI